jgi:dCMP deaminase
MLKSWDKYFMDMIPLIASRSKDQSTQVGCIIVGPDHEIRSTGYNSFPRGMDDSNPKWHERPLKYSVTEHAERNAIYNLARMGLSGNGCTIYQPWLPCCDCARAIIQTGIVKVVIDGRNFKKDLEYWEQRWKDSMIVSMDMLHQANVVVEVFTEFENWVWTTYENKRT